MRGNILGWTVTTGNSCHRNRILLAVLAGRKAVCVNPGVFRGVSQMQLPAVGRRWKFCDRGAVWEIHDVLRHSQFVLADFNSLCRSGSGHCHVGVIHSGVVGVCQRCDYSKSCKSGWSTTSVCRLTDWWRSWNLSQWLGQPRGAAGLWSRQWSIQPWKLFVGLVSILDVWWSCSDPRLVSPCLPRPQEEGDIGGTVSVITCIPHFPNQRAAVNKTFVSCYLHDRTLTWDQITSLIYTMQYYILNKKRKYAHYEQ